MRKKEIQKDVDGDSDGSKLFTCEFLFKHSFYHTRLQDFQPQKKYYTL